MEKKINIATEIVTRLDSLGYPCTIASSDYMIMANFLMGNLTKLLGSHEIDNDDVEIVRSKHTITVNTTFYPTPIVFEVNKTDDDVSLSALADEEGQEIFRISKNGEHVENTIFDRDNFFEHTYVVDGFMDPKFTYTKKQVNEDSKEVIFSAQLRGLGAKYKDKEVFELTRIVPPEYKEQSLLKRIVDGIKGDSFIQITTSLQTLDTLMYTDILFNRLELEGRKYTFRSEEVGQTLQKK